MVESLTDSVKSKIKAADGVILDDETVDDVILAFKVFVQTNFDEEDEKDPDDLGEQMKQLELS